MKTIKDFFEEKIIDTNSPQKDVIVTQKRLENQKNLALDNQDKQRREREQREAENKNRQKEARLKSLEQQIQSIKSQQ